jgi:hypothetical protein
MIRFHALVVALVTGLAAPSSYAQLNLVAYDGFDYTTGALNGKNGGSGWAGSWAWTYGSGSSLAVSATGLTFSGLSTTGGSATWSSGGNGISEASRSLSSSVGSGVVYLQFLGQFGSSSGGGTPNIRLTLSGSLTGGIGGNGGTYGGVVSILGTDLNPAGNGSSSTAASLSSLNLIVTRIDYGANTTSIWMNPNLASFNYGNPGTPDAIYSGLAPAFDTVQLITRNPGTFDELSVYSYSAVPEPSTYAAIVGAGALLVATARRRRLLCNTGFAEVPARSGIRVRPGSS